MRESFSVITVKYTRTESKLDKCRDKESPKYHGRYWGEHFLPCIIRSENKRKQSEDSRECGHRYRDDAFERSFQNSIFIKWQSFFKTEVFVVIDEHDSIAWDDTHKGDEAHQMSCRYDSSCEPYSENPSEPSRDNPEKYLKDEDDAPKVPIEDSKKSEKYSNRDEHEKFGWFLLGRVESLIRDPISCWNIEFFYFYLYIIYDIDYRSIFRISWYDDTSRWILMIDYISRLPEFYICDISYEECPLIRKPKWDTSYRLWSTRPWSRKPHDDWIWVLSLDHTSDFLPSYTDIEEFLHFIVVHFLRDERRSIGYDGDTWYFCLRFERDIECTFDGVRYFDDLFSDSFESVEVFSKYLDYERCSDSWDDLLDSMSNWLTDTNYSDRLIFLYDGIDLIIDSRFFIVRHIWGKCYFYFCIIGSLSMSVCIGTSEYRSCSLDSGNFSEIEREIFCHIERIVERASWLGRDRYSIAWLIERWESLFTRHHISEYCEWYG